MNGQKITHENSKVKKNEKQNQNNHIDIDSVAEQRADNSQEKFNNDNNTNANVQQGDGIVTNIQFT